MEENVMYDFQDHQYFGKLLLIKVYSTIYLKKSLVFVSIKYYIILTIINIKE